MGLSSGVLPRGRLPLVRPSAPQDGNRTLRSSVTMTAINKLRSRRPLPLPLLGLPSPRDSPLQLHHEQVPVVPCRRLGYCPGVSLYGHPRVRFPNGTACVSSKLMVLSLERIVVLLPFYLYRNKGFCIVKFLTFFLSTGLPTPQWCFFDGNESSCLRFVG